MQTSLRKRQETKFLENNTFSLRRTVRSVRNKLPKQCGYDIQMSLCSNKTQNLAWQLAHVHFVSSAALGVLVQPLNQPLNCKNK